MTQPHDEDGEEVVTSHSGLLAEVERLRTVVAGLQERVACWMEIAGDLADLAGIFKRRAEKKEKGDS